MRSVTVERAPRRLHGFGEFRLAHRLVRGVEPGIEQLHHPRLDDVGSLRVTTTTGLRLLMQ